MSCKLLPVSLNPACDFFVSARLDIDASSDSSQLTALRAPLQVAVECRVAGCKQKFFGLSFFRFESAHLALSLSQLSFYFNLFVVFWLILGHSTCASDVVFPLMNPLS